MAWLEKRNGKFRVCYRDGSGTVKRIAAYTDKLASRQMLADFEMAIARGEQGLLDPFREHKARPLTEHVSEPQRAQRVAHATPKRQKLAVTGTGADSASMLATD